MTSNNQIKKVPNKAGRPPKIVSEQRMLEVVSLLLDLKPKKEIYQYIYDNYGVGTKTCDYLIAEAYKVIKADYNVDREAVVNTHIQKYYEIANNCNGLDSKNQLAALAAVEKLLRLHQPDVAIQNNTLNLDLKDVSIADLKELLNNNG